MTHCTQCGGTELVEDALGKTIRCPECAGKSRQDTDKRRKLMAHMDDKMNSDPISSIEKEVRETIAEKQLAERDQAVAQRRVTDSINKLNNLRKRWEAEIAKLSEQDGLRGTDWEPTKWRSAREA